RQTMKYRLPAVLLAAALAGCTAQRQPSLPYSPAAEPLPQTGSTARSTTLPASAGLSGAQTATVAGFPPPPACDANALDPACAPALQEKKCRTVGNVTTCNVPGDPGADQTLYTN